jgi:hypothetical protein
MLRLLNARKGSEFGENAEATASIAINITWALAALARDDVGHQNAIRKGGGIALLVSLLKGPAQLDLQLGAAVVAALSDVVQNNEANAHEMLPALAVAPLLQVLLDPSGLGRSESFPCLMCLV